MAIVEEAPAIIIEEAAPIETAPIVEVPIVEAPAVETAPVSKHQLKLQ